MTAHLEYTFEMTPEFARAVVPELEAVLWMQNERIYVHAGGLSRVRRGLRVAGVVVSLLGVALSEYAFYSTRRGGDVYLSWATVFAAFAVLFALLPRIAPLLRRLTRRLVAFRARRTMEQVARRAPYLVRYTLADGKLTAQVERLALNLTLELRSVALAIAATSFVCAFPKAYSMRKMRVLYVPGSAERAALLEALRAAGATVSN